MQTHCLLHFTYIIMLLNHVNASCQMWFPMLYRLGPVWLISCSQDFKDEHLSACPTYQDVHALWLCVLFWPFFIFFSFLNILKAPARWQYLAFGYVAEDHRDPQCTWMKSVSRCPLLTGALLRTLARSHTHIYHHAQTRTHMERLYQVSFLFKHPGERI